MSIKAMSLVFESELKGELKLVMLALADYANDSGYCFPSQESVARHASISVRTLRRRLDDLEEGGWLVRERRHDADGHRKTDGYRLLPAKLTGRPTGQNQGAYRPTVAAIKEPSVRTTSRKKESAREVPLPKDWQPTDAHRQRAVELGVNVEREAELFRLHAETHGRTAKQWNSAFTTWLIKAGEKTNVTPIRPDLTALPPKKSYEERKAEEREEALRFKQHSVAIAQYYEEWIAAGSPRPWPGPSGKWDHHES